MPNLLWKTAMKEPLIIYKKDLWKLYPAGDSLQLQPVCRDCCPERAHIITAQMWEDRGIIFLGSDINGLYVIKTPFLQSLRINTGVESSRAEYAQAEITPGEVSTASGLSFSSKGELLPNKKATQFHPFTSYRDRNGDHWFHSKDTIIHFHRGRPLCHNNRS